MHVDRRRSGLDRTRFSSACKQEHCYLSLVVLDFFNLLRSIDYGGREHLARVCADRKTSQRRSNKENAVEQVRRQFSSLDILHRTLMKMNGSSKWKSNKEEDTQCILDRHRRCGDTNTTMIDKRSPGTTIINTTTTTLVGFSLFRLLSTRKTTRSSCLSLCLVILSHQVSSCVNKRAEAEKPKLYTFYSLSISKQKQTVWQR